MDWWAGRRDDLWSWLYIMVEMITGTLPWRNEEGRDREQVSCGGLWLLHPCSAHTDEYVVRTCSQCSVHPEGIMCISWPLKVVRLKRDCMEDPSKLSSSMPLPAALARISNHLTQLNFEADPDYALLRQCLDDLISQVSMHWLCCTHMLNTDADVQYW